MTKYFSLQGVFWSPEDTEQKFTGTLERTTKGDMMLSVYTGTKKSSLSMFHQNSDTIDASLNILGLTIDRCLWTLECSKESTNRACYSDISIKVFTYRVHTAFEGFAREDVKDLGFSEVSFGLGDIAGWINKKKVFELADKIEGDRRIRYPSNVPFVETAFIEGIGNVEANVSTVTETSYAETHSVLKTVFTLKFDQPQKIEDIHSYINYLENFVTICANTIVAANEITVLPEHDPALKSRVYVWDSRGEVIEQLTPSESYDKFLSHGFQYIDIGGIDGIAKWIKQMKDNPNEAYLVAQLVAAQFENMKYSQSIIFHMVTSCLMLTKNKKNSKIESRIKEVIDGLSDVLPEYVLDADFAKALAETRSNFVAHPELARPINDYDIISVVYASNLLYEIIRSHIARNWLCIDNAIISEKIWGTEKMATELDFAKQHCLKKCLLNE